MLGSIAVEKGINACETAQICVDLHVGEVISLDESSYTSHYIFNSIKYFFLIHDYALLLTIKSLTSISSNSEILTSVSREGCILLEHHRETIASFLPTCPASHLPVLPFSTNATFILFIFYPPPRHHASQGSICKFSKKSDMVINQSVVKKLCLSVHDRNK